MHILKHPTFSVLKHVFEHIIISVSRLSPYTWKNIFLIYMSCYILEVYILAKYQSLNQLKLMRLLHSQSLSRYIHVSNKVT